MDGWETIYFHFGVKRPIFRCHVSFKEGNPKRTFQPPMIGDSCFPPRTIHLPFQDMHVSRNLAENSVHRSLPFTPAKNYYNSHATETP